MCRQEYLHFLRIREWQDLHAQLRDIARDLKLQRNSAARPDRAGAHRHPHRSAVPGRAGRHQGGAGQGPAEASGTGTPAGVHRRPRHPVRDQPRLVVGQNPTTVGDGRGDRGDHPAVGPYGRSGQRRPGGGGRRARDQAHVRRAALVVPPGRRDGVGDGQPVRRADRGRSQGPVRAGEPGRGPRDLPPRRRWSRGSGGPGTTSSRTTSSCERRPPSSRSGPGVATWWSTTR